MEYIDAIDFTFNGKNSKSDFGYIIVSFDKSSGFSEPDTAQSLEVTKENVGNNPKAKLIELSYENVLQPCFGLMKCDGEAFSKEEIRNIHKWLMVNEYTTLLINNSLCNNVHFNAIATNIEIKKINSGIVGVAVTFECDSPYGYQTASTSYTISGNKTFALNNTSDDFLNNEIYIKPYIKIIKEDSGDFTIKNTTLNQTTVLNLLNQEEVIMDCENMILSSSIPNRNLYSKFNRVWVSLALGNNSIKVIGNGTITISYDVARKVGI